MKKVQILFTAAALTFGLALAASADNCCAQKGLKAGWFTGSGSLAQAGHDHKADGSCCTNAKADAKAAGCACGKSDGKAAAGNCCSGNSDGKAASEAGKCCGNCKK
ncbi:MAG: hypothetical protein KF760_24405 [Candidatus Eremiobacteraeota bacterium]|nr:hypothetical protein [Candidatus Eremiobacteraeota bacterium]MCW5867522.1 hypothetical protein [Candidatus Eremiobacteraeota bacterium]